MESTEKKANVLLLGGGAVGAIAALNIESGGLGSVTAVLRSNFKVVEEEGYKIESVDHGNFKGWRPTKVVNSVPDNCPDIPPSLVSLIAPAVTPGHTTIGMIQNGLNIEAPLFAAFPTNMVLSGVSMIDSHEDVPGTIHHEFADDLLLGAFHNPSIKNPEREIATAKEFIKIYGAAGKTNVRFNDNVPYSRWRKLIFHAVLNPLCAIRGWTMLESGLQGALSKVW
ncbi:Uncharacterized protein LARI1_G004852 [Lachnellula arida]|uniref:Ketopantoate reductase N-terminal domain-containing protein n=1 Tax=Lachnellula arida TaxID=1316785 RepID=A0A8T9BC82_9HELO|nr:Uncharacterized protein LARI1_G004852 [Lachnellula arida]